MCRKLKYEGMYRIEAQGFRGDLHLVKSDTQYVTTNVNEGSIQSWALTVIYASPNETLRQSLWTDLNEFGNTCNKPCLLAGDFNETRNMKERFSCSDDLTRRCNNFNLWIKNNHLIELGFSGPRGNTVKTRKYAQLDRGHCNEQWRMRFEEASVRHLLQNKLDHSPLLISLHGLTSVQPTMRPFRFQVARLSHTLFEDFLKDNWKQQDPLYPSLSRLSIVLEEWNKAVFRNLFHQRREIWAQLEGIQKRLPLEQNYLIRDLEEVLDQIGIFWFQKSLAEAIRDGDRNTRFYHLCTIIHRKINMIELLQDQNGQITKSKQVGGLGFRTMRENNAAFLSKLGWHLMVEKEKLWSQVLRAKYCNSRCDVDMFQPKLIHRTLGVGSWKM
ncbi:hypothetical protein Cgig2_011813 [Carnegiea gigantea]|uniref:Endonuclease/exonuclease/phosphatase domain-containing protein n=1 Tax=Carnegiea gigantea TaxID=171969 RepID=A0A9Q1JXG8_9CARY|nr:hypothetical protein Cgig2_011813 [Carnegiea gigantea]